MTNYPEIGKLSDKHRIFCEAYCRFWNAAKAAREAGYSEATAKEQGSRLLTNVNVQKYIQFIKDNAFEFAGVSLLRNAQELAKVAYGSGADIRKAWESLEEWEGLPDEVKATIAEVTTTTRVIKTMGGDEEAGASIVQAIESVKVKQYDKLKALEILNRMAGYNAADKVETSNPDGSLRPKTTIIFSDGSKREGNNDTPEIRSSLEGG